MVIFEDYKKKRLAADPALREAYDALENEYSIMQTLIDARKHTGMTQKELSLASGVPQADISRLENGNGNPSLHTLKKLAHGLGMELKIAFIPRS